MRRILALPIRLYQTCLSPLLGPGKCRFEPTCSSYALEALETHGALRGLLLTLWRLLRCQPFCRGGFDPVPPRRASTSGLHPRDHTPPRHGPPAPGPGSSAGDF